MTVARGNDVGVVSVDYYTEEVTAVPGADYVPVEGTLRFEQGEDRLDIEIPILNDEGNETGGFHFDLFSYERHSAMISSLPHIIHLSIISMRSFESKPLSKLLTTCK